jgi:hypothetical protein
MRMEAYIFIYFKRVLFTLRSSADKRIETKKRRYWSRKKGRENNVSN